MRSTLALITVLLLSMTVPSAARQPSWHITATVAESCSCTISCPCNFGGEPSHMPCEGNRMISIEQGHYDNVDDRQMKAVEALLPLAFAGFHRGMLSFTKAPITMEATESRVKFSGPESFVEMEVLKGFNGKAVKVLNLPSAVFQDYTQFRSVSHTHTSAAHSWSHTGTNGFTSRWEAASAK